MTDSISHSQAPKAVSAWREELNAKNRPKIAASIAHPEENAELFTEGWENALEREREPPSTTTMTVDESESPT